MGKLFLLAAVAFLGCDYYDRVANADGEVYECDQADGTTVELCYFADSAAELAERTGSTSCGLTDRWFPVLTNAVHRGCRYVCPGKVGCNAEQGCYCPAATPLAQPASMLSTAVLDLLHVTGDGECESTWIQPAVSCRNSLHVLGYDGCRWRCVSILDLPREELQ